MEHVDACEITSIKSEQLLWYFTTIHFIFRMPENKEVRCCNASMNSFFLILHTSFFIAVSAEVSK